MGTRSLKASQKGIDRALIALAEYSLSQNALAKDLGLSRQPVNNFFKGIPIERENFALICDRLGLDLENTVAIADPPEEAGKLIDIPELDELVREVREKVRANIQQRCGEMKVLDMSCPIDLGTIYTEINILRDITGRQRQEIAELLKDCGLEEFDRLGFAHAKRERRSGLEAVEKFAKLMLLGKPGAGKTTFLKRLAILCNAGEFQENLVPIFISLKEFSDSSKKPEFLPYISQWFCDRGIRQPDGAEQILKRGRGFLLLDGLDEVKEINSEWILRQIKSFSDRFPDNAFVVSCRIAAKEFTFQSFTEVEVADFTDDQIAGFAERWFGAKQLPAKTQEFSEQLEKYPRIKELATNPLLLTLLCLVFEDRTDFPVNRSELYKEGLDVLLKKWDGKRSIKRKEIYRELSLKRKEDMLSQLAYTTFASGDYFFKQKDAERLIESYIENLPGARTDPDALRLDSEAVLKSIEAQHGLLVERAREIYSFSHLTFHEYFTARYIEQDDTLYPVLISHLTEARWREVILLTVGMARNADSLLLMMKSWIDGMLANEEKLQEFLAWVNRKARSVNAPYKPVALRAFYFIVGLNLDFRLASSLGLTGTSDLTGTSVFSLKYAINFTISHFPALALDHTLIITLTSALASDRTNSFKFVLASVSSHAITLSDELERAIRKLGNLLPDSTDLDLNGRSPEDRDHFKQWWQSNGSTWTEKLRAVMIEHRDIGHDWQFNNRQSELLRQYHDANELLVDCLKSDCYVSRPVCEEIEASLLLPMAELQQQFPNQYRSPSSSSEG